MPATGVMLANSNVTGVINGAGSTFQTGDIINGNATSNAAVTIAAVNGGNTLVTINSLQGITFRTLVAEAVNAQLFNNVGTVASSGSTNILTVNNGALASTYALSNTIGNTNAVRDGLTIGLRAGDITGASNTINFAVTGVGTAGNTPAGTPAFDSRLVSASGGVEGISVATTGTNFFTVGGSTAAATDSRTLAITGAGRNTIDARGMTQANSFNLSGSTGTNTLRLDNVLTSGSTVTGGTGADTLRLAPTANNVVANLNVSAVETLRLGTGSNTGTLLFTAAPNFTNVRIDGDLAEAGTYTLGTVGSFANLNFIGDGVTANSNAIQQFNSLTVNGSFAGASDTVAVKLGNAGTSNTAGLNARTFTANGVEAINVTLADVTAAAASEINLTSNTLGSVSFNGLGSITSTINAAPANEPGGLTSVNLTGMTTAGVISSVDLDNGSTGNNTTVTASTGGTTLNLQGGAASAGDTLNFVGGVGTDTITANLDGGFRGTIIANLGAGAAQVINTTNFAGAATSVTSTAAASVNTINVNGSGIVSFVASGAGSVNTVTAAAAQAAVAAVRQVSTMTPAAALGGAENNSLAVQLGGAQYTVVRDNNQTITLALFVTNNAAAILANTGVTVTSTATTLVFTGPVNGAGFIPPTGFTTVAQTGVTSAAPVGTAAGAPQIAGVDTTLTGAGSSSAITFVGSANADTITGGAGNDTITGGAGADILTGGGGADQFGTANNFGAALTSIVASAETFTQAAIAAGETITFATTRANNVDRITDFVSGIDKLDVVNAATAPTTLIGVADDAVLDNGITFVAFGTYVEATGVFTTAAAFNAATANAAIMITGNGALTAANHTGYQVFTGLNQAFVAADFV